MKACRGIKKDTTGSSSQQTKHNALLITDLINESASEG